MTQSGYIRLATTVALCMGMTDGKVLFCHVVSEGSGENNFLTREYKNTTVYD